MRLAVENVLETGLSSRYFKVLHSMDTNLGQLRQRKEAAGLRIVVANRTDTVFYEEVLKRINGKRWIIIAKTKRRESLIGHLIRHKK